MPTKPITQADVNEAMHKEVDRENVIRDLRAAATEKVQIAYCVAATQAEAAWKLVQQAELNLVKAMDNWDRAMEAKQVLLDQGAKDDLN